MCSYNYANYANDKKTFVVSLARLATSLVTSPCQKIYSKNENIQSYSTSNSNKN